MQPLQLKDELGVGLGGSAADHKDGSNALFMGQSIVLLYQRDKMSPPVHAQAGQPRPCQISQDEQPHASDVGPPKKSRVVLAAHAEQCILHTWPPCGEVLAWWETHPKAQGGGQGQPQLSTLPVREVQCQVCPLQPGFVQP